MATAEQIAEAFHNAYERLAPEHDYETRASRRTWQEIPENNRELMVSVVTELLENGIITVPKY